MDRTSKLLIVAGVGVGGYFLWRHYQGRTHPMLGELTGNGELGPPPEVPEWVPDEHRHGYIYCSGIRRLGRTAPAEQVEMCYRLFGIHVTPERG